MTFGEKLREMRQARGISQRYLAMEFGINYTYLSKLENGQETSCSPQVLTRIADACGYPVDYVFHIAGRCPHCLGTGKTPNGEGE